MSIDLVKIKQKLFNISLNNPLECDKHINSFLFKKELLKTSNHKL